MELNEYMFDRVGMYCVVLTIRDGNLMIGMGIPDDRKVSFLTIGKGILWGL